MTDTLSTRLASRVAFEGRVFTVAVDRVRLPHGPEVDLEVVRHRASVVLLPMPDPEHVVLVRQYRYPIDRLVWELPAGTLEPGEDPRAAALRECEEETKLAAASAERLAAFFPTPGYCDEEMIFYRLTGLTRPDAPAAHDEDEHLEPRVFPVAEARAMIRTGEIVDMKTALGLLLV